MSASDDERPVELFDEELEILSDMDERDAGWGGPDRDDSERLSQERPPHWG